MAPDVCSLGSTRSLLQAAAQFNLRQGTAGRAAHNIYCVLAHCRGLRGPLHAAPTFFTGPMVFLNRSMPSARDSISTRTYAQVQR